MESKQISYRISPPTRFKYQNKTEMKTPMQELLEWVRETLPMDLETPRLITPRLIEHKIESMLEKEKEVMCEFAFNCIIYAAWYM